MKRPGKLSPKQALFVEQYLIDLNATQAAIRAGYSPRTASSQGQRLLRNVEILAAVSVAQKASLARVELVADDVIRSLWQEARREGDGCSHGARVSALTTLAKHFGLLEPKHPLAVDVTSGGKPLERSSLTAADLVACAALVGMAGLGVSADGGPQSVAALQSAGEAASISPAL